jgi:hypothetical protein
MQSPATEEPFDRDILWRQRAVIEPVSIIDLLFIDPSEHLPVVLARLKILITKLKSKIHLFCKSANVFAILKMRDCYFNLLVKLKELDLRT